MTKDQQIPAAVLRRDDEGGPLPQMVAQRREQLRQEREASPSSNERVAISAEGSELMMELFNRMPIESLKSVPEPIAKRIGDFMVANGYRIVFDRWFLQADPKAPERSADETSTVLTEAEELLKSWADPLPPNGELYWTHVEKAREYFKRRPAVEPEAERAKRIGARIPYDIGLRDDGSHGECGTNPPYVKASEQQHECMCASYCMVAAGSKFDPPVKCRGLTGEDPGSHIRFPRR